MKTYTSLVALGFVLAVSAACGGEFRAIVPDQELAAADAEPTPLTPPPPGQELLPKPPLLEPPLPDIGQPYTSAPIQPSFPEGTLSEPAIGAGREPYSPFGQAPREGSYLLAGGWLDQFGARYEDFKRRYDIPISISAWHWWHVNTGGPLASGYGIPGENGTFYYGLEASPELCCPLGPFEKVGVYTDVHFRDGGTPMRPFYPSDTAWLSQGYAWGLTSSGGVMKAGAIWRRFGLDWDGSWWGSVPYYDGFMLSTGLGISWEHTPEMTNGFKVDRFYQFFFHDYLDYSLVGANPRSVIGSSEVGTFIARLVPTVQLSRDETLALGFSGMVGEIDNADQLSLVGFPTVYPSPGNQTLGAWASDLTYTRGNFKVFAEALQAFGKLSPARYVSGGPSNQITDFLVGFNLTRGAITYRASYSMGFDDNPSGTQALFVPGVTVALTRNTALYAEYVLQKIRPSGNEHFTTYENGLQFVLNWRF